MENYFLKDFSVESKHPSPEAQRKWRSAVALVRNPRRRFRHVADLVKRSEAQKKRKSIQEKIRVALYVQKAALQFIDAGGRIEYKLSQEAREAGFDIHPDELAAIIRSHDVRAMNVHGRVPGIAKKVKVESLDDGVSEKDIPIRQKDGAAKMLVTTVGMRTEWGKLMETLSEGGDDETPLQVKLNGVATIIGKIGLTFAVLTFLVLTTRFLINKALLNEISVWSSVDALTLLDYFAIAVTIIVVAVPEGLPLAVTLSLAFAMSKLMSERALVRHLSACETMGSTSCICTDKTETAILEFGLLLGAEFKEQRKDMNILKIEPFNSARKKMSVLVARPNGGKRAFCKGASEIILSMCNKVIDSKGEPIDLSDQQAKNVSDVFNEINSRDIEKINIFHGMFSSWVFIGVMFITVAFQVIIVEFLGAFASTVPLTWQLWLLSIGIGSISLIVAVFLKCIPVEKKINIKHHDGYEALPSGPELA
ncbi:hypothetical protein F8388_022395 [Cannabis sativa]|uniref:Calcium-transporting P-type ATPase N-terminal autoinhibitory domain-containing protein n=1 Tax=Cannabis sativa TaxID=3483 RepID=A0A7J6EWH9_CANSA|nr:hypothetical protein G4B88_001224 [Cannabis sativa]KAF4362738.1 hypothetical protein F8388_022395 [Cannabis sativa]